jgi:hypothetical protein
VMSSYVLQMLYVQECGDGGWRVLSSQEMARVGLSGLGEKSGRSIWRVTEDIPEE